MFDKEERSTDDARGETIPVFFIVPIYVSSKYDTTVRVQSLIVYFAKKPQPLYTMFDKEERSTDDARGETIPVFFIVPVYVSSKYDTQ